MEARGHDASTSLPSRREVNSVSLDTVPRASQGPHTPGPLSPIAVRPAILPAYGSGALDGAVPYVRLCDRGWVLPRVGTVQVTRSLGNVSVVRRLRFSIGRLWWGVRSGEVRGVVSKGPWVRLSSSWLATAGRGPAPAMGVPPARTRPEGGEPRTSRRNPVTANRQKRGAPSSARLLCIPGAL